MIDDASLARGFGTMGLPSVHSLVLLAILGTIAFMALLALYSWRQRQVPGAIPFAVWAMLIAARGVLSVLGVLWPDSFTQYHLLELNLALQLPAPMAALVFSVRYAGNDGWVNRRTLALLLLPVVGFAGLALTNDTHRWILSEEAWVEGNIRFSLSTGGWLLMGYGYLLVLINTVVLVALFVRSPRHRWPVGLILLGLLPPRILVGLSSTTLQTADVPALPLVSYTFAGLLCAIALFRFHLFDVVPVARESVLERMVDGMLVLDAQGRVADLNPAAQELLGTPRSLVLGRDSALVLADQPDLARVALDLAPRQVEVPLPGASATQRWCQVSSSPLTDRQGFRLGQLILLQDVTEQRRGRELLQQQQRMLAVLQERERLARELHDGLGQMLAASHLQATAARRLLAQGAHAETDECLEVLAEITLEAQADVREYLLGARTAFSAECPFFQSLHQYLGLFSQRYGLKVELSVPPELEARGMAAAVEVQLLRVIQEALSNVRKHARASCASVSFTTAGDRALITVADDGQGFDPGGVASQGEGFGLRAMRERAEGLGGSLAVTSCPGQGTRLVVEVPLAG